MGVPDTVTYEYMKRNEVFADAFNFLLYNGEKIIDHSELKELDTKTIAYIFNESKGKKAHRAIQKFRDIFKQAIVAAGSGCKAAMEAEKYLQSLS